MPRLVHIGLIFDYGTGYCQGVLRGIKQFAAAKPHWVLMPSVPELNALGALGKLKVDGYIAYIFRPRIIEALKQLQRPSVNVCGVVADTGIPSVGTDCVRMGRLAARHLVDRGIQHFGFIGHSHHAGSALREAGFRSAIGQAGFTLSCFYDHGPQRFDSRLQRWAFGDEVRKWVLWLPKPVGVSAFYDMWGLQLLEVCREVGLRVPEDVAMVGMGNDELLCELSRPSLSSVAVPAEQIGHEAAALLERLMDGAPPPGRPILLPPIGVITRQSSDLLAIGDPEVAAAVRLIRQRGHLAIQVKDILHEVPVARRSLERKFRAILNRGICEEIRRVHIERAMGLLAGTDLAMPAVAENTGFSSSSRLSVVFRRETGMTPTAYRLQFRSPPRQPGGNTLPLN